jgi:hypothetical protein
VYNFATIILHDQIHRNDTVVRYRRADTPANISIAADHGDDGMSIDVTRTPDNNVTEQLVTASVRPTSTTARPPVDTTELTAPTNSDIYARPSNMHGQPELWRLPRQMLLNGVVGLAATAATIVYYMCMHKFGARFIVPITLIVSGLATSGTLLTDCCNVHIHPTALALGHNSGSVVLAARAVQGVCVGACFPLISLVLTNWASIRNRPLFLAHMAAFVPAGGEHRASVVRTHRCPQLCCAIQLARWLSLPT